MYLNHPATGTRRNLIGTLALFGMLCLGVWELRAQHYPAGAEGLRAATLPPPGVYLRDYNIGYFGDQEVPGFPGMGKIEVKAWVYRNAPRLIWMTGIKILGADYGMDVIVPFGYTEVEVGGQSDDAFGLDDIQIEPLLLSWHAKKFDFAAGYAVWAPTGDFDANEMANLGRGFWGHMITGGATWNIDEQKTWTLSVLNRYEINHEQEDTDITPGQQLTIEAAMGKTIGKGVDIGVVGYWKQQTTENSAGPGRDSLSYVGALGAEISGMIPKIQLATSLRYLREFEAKDALEGNVLVLTLTKRF